MALRAALESGPDRRPCQRLQAACTAALPPPPAAEPCRRALPPARSAPSASAAAAHGHTTPTHPQPLLLRQPLRLLLRLALRLQGFLRSGPRTHWGLRDKLLCSLHAQPARGTSPATAGSGRCASGRPAARAPQPSLSAQLSQPPSSPYSIRTCMRRTAADTLGPPFLPFPAGAASAERDGDRHGLAHTANWRRAHAGLQARGRTAGA